MNLKVNNINFQGKEEIFYGLEKASRLSQDLSLCKNSYKYISQSQLAKADKFEASIKAYLDMVTKDSEFNESVLLSFGKKLFGIITENIRPIETDHGVITPLKEFTELLKSAMKENNTLYIPEKVRASETLLSYFV